MVLILYGSPILWRISGLALKNGFIFFFFYFRKPCDQRIWNHRTHRQRWSRCVWQLLVFTMLHQRCFCADTLAYVLKAFKASLFNHTIYSVFLFLKTFLDQDFSLQLQVINQNRFLTEIGFYPLLVRFSEESCVSRRNQGFGSRSAWIRMDPH